MRKCLTTLFMSVSGCAFGEKVRAVKEAKAVSANKHQKPPSLRTPFHVKKRCEDGEIHKQLQQGRTTGQREATYQRGQSCHRQKQGDGRVRLRSARKQVCSLTARPMGWLLLTFSEFILEFKHILGHFRSVTFFSYIR